MMRDGYVVAVGVPFSDEVCCLLVVSSLKAAKCYQLPEGIGYELFMKSKKPVLYSGSSQMDFLAELRRAMLDAKASPDA